MAGAAPAPANAACARCGAPLRCGGIGQDARCWCARLPQVPGLAAQSPWSSCLCPDCLTAQIAEKIAEQAAEPSAGLQDARRGGTTP